MALLCSSLFHGSRDMLVASPAASKAAKDDEDPDQDPADNLKNKGEEHRSFHAVVRARHVLRRPVWPTAENHNGAPDESDNFKKAGHSSEAAQQAKATSLGTGDPAVSQSKLASKSSEETTCELNTF